MDKFLHILVIITAVSIYIVVYGSILVEIQAGKRISF